MKNRLLLQFSLKFLFLFTVLLCGKNFSAYGQNTFNITPNGVLDNVYDRLGNHYNLYDLMISDQNSSSSSKSTLLSCGTNSIFNLYFEPGCGMEDTSNPTHNARRAVVCQVFQDISNFLTTTNSALQANSITKVNIWVRKIGSVYNNPAGILGMGTGFYNLPLSTINGGITDNEIWKTIHTGTDSYLNSTVPLNPIGGGTNQAGLFYHGMITFNFDDPNIVWNTNTSLTSIPITQFDLYSAVLHEVVHSLGFYSLINSDGNSKLGSNFKYYSRYDTFLKTNDLSNYLLTTSACSSMYDNSFNSSLNTTILHPGPSTPCSSTTLCGDAIKFAGTTVVPVFTPNCFIDISSLSHFEDALFPSCLAPYGNDSYFLMCNSGDSGTVRRYLKPEERSALCTIGYDVNTTFGPIGSSYYYNYGGSTSCGGIVVAGINDGIANNGTYSFTGTLVGTNATITIPVSSILNNDRNAIGYECLQDLTATVSFPSTITATASTITFSSGLVGLHLLRYVPINGSQKGNITYIYVLVQPSTNPISCNPNSINCNLVSNGDFEQNNLYLTQPTYNQFERACGWQNVGGLYSSYFYTNNVDPNYNTPCNLYGNEADRIANNHGYVGICTRVNNWSSFISTTLNSPLSPSTTYQVSFDVSLAEFVDYIFPQIQVFISNTPPTALNSLLSIPNTIINTGILLPNASSTPSINTPIYTDNVNGWKTITFTFTTSSTIASNLNFLYLGGLNNYQFQTGLTPTSSVSNCANNYNFIPNDGSISYIDNVSLIAIGNASLNLPSSICISQNISDLTGYLTNVPHTGVFSGPGVVLSNGVYSFNASIAGIGVQTINYTYNNSNNCPITISGTIIVSNTSLITPTFTLTSTLCSGDTAPVLTTTSNNNITGTWNPSVVSTTATATYIFTPSLGSCANTVTKKITVVSYPVINSILPATQTVCLNSSAQNLQVIATGTSLSYQWYSNTINANTGGTLISNATSASYIPPSSAVGTKYYYVIVKSSGNCIITSNTLTVTVVSGTATTGTLSGTQTICKNSNTVFTATVSGGTWNSSNPTVATIISSSGNTITISGLAAGSSIISYTINGTNGCSASVTRTVTVSNPTVPSFLDLGDSAFCQGSSAPLLPTTSDNGITGSWNPATVSTTNSGNYTFTPSSGTCVSATNLPIMVIPTNAFIANDDYFTVTYPSSNVITNTVLLDDTYNGNYLANVTSGTTSYIPMPIGVSYTIVPTGSNPTFTTGGISMNSNGTFTVLPNTPGGTYIFHYYLQTPCGNTPPATVTIYIGKYTEGPGKIDMLFCFNALTASNSTNDINGVTNLFYGSTVAGLPANSNNATIQLAAGYTVPTPISINYSTGVVTTAANAFPGIYEIYYQVCANGNCSSNIKCTVGIRSTIYASNDVVYINSNGAIIWPTTGTYSVLSNDYKYNCTTDTNSPVIVSGAGQNANFTVITPNGNNGSITFDVSNGNLFRNLLSYSIGSSYFLQYQICDINNPSICTSQSVTVYVQNTPPAFASNPIVNHIAKIPKKTSKSNSTPQIINFPDAVLKQKLLTYGVCGNITLTGDIQVDANGDGEIDTDEALTVGKINISNSNVNNLTGLIYFSNLKWLSIAATQVTSIINNQLPNTLEAFGVHFLPITSLDLSYFPNLINLDCLNNQIVSLDASANPNLQILNIQNTANLHSLNIKNTSILDYNNSQMTDFCWTGCPNLTNICADSNEIPALMSYLNSCGVTTSGIDINSNCTLSVESNTLAPQITLSPNPSKGIVMIDFDNGITTNTTVTIYNVLGQHLMHFIVPENDKAVKLDLSNYPSGTYFAKIIQEDVMVVKTIVRE